VPYPMAIGRVSEGREMEIFGDCQEGGGGVCRGFSIFTRTSSECDKQKKS
jgi:hypothetical protein